jgi:hypothetical protein
VIDESAGPPLVMMNGYSKLRRAYPTTKSTCRAIARLISGIVIERSCRKLLAPSSVAAS